MASDELVFAGIDNHLDRFFGGRQHDDLVWPVGPVETHLPGFRVRRIRPKSVAEPWIFVSVGSWRTSDDDGRHRTEFVLLAPDDDARHVELLAMVANLHADPRYRVGLGSTIHIGRPWVRGSAADHLLVSLPYPFGPDLEVCDLADVHVRLLWLVPITGAEADVVRSEGAHVLEARFEAGGINVVSPIRSSAF